MPFLNVIALISGGKDSLFSILHCLKNGHHVVALANLHPPVPPGHTEETDDLNSYMYQTVGHSVIPLYEQALGIPLYRQEIVGEPVNKERDYEVAGEKGDGVVDETESLFSLLERVLQKHPEANAVSTGAILSTYQRTRVESVALRLNLTPLSYLWQYPVLPPYFQSALLRDMGAVGQDARIIKVASGGIDESFLGANVAEPRTIARLGKAVGRFGGNADGAVLGEGGEFETLALDGPGVLWKGRIEVEFEGAVVGEGGNACAKWKGARVVGKEVGKDEEGGLMNLRIPGLWDEEFEKVNDMLSKALPSFQENQDPGSFPNNTNHAPKTYQPQISSTPTTLTISNLTPPKSCTTPSSQLSSILQTLTTILQTHNTPLSSVIHTTLLLRSISTFSTLNPVYSTHFTSINPPSRVTVACGATMPEGVDVMLSAIVDKTGRRKGLHVQSRSYWAPANIGPYSQAVSAPVTENVGEETECVPRAVYLAGQIPLVPASMEVVGADGSDRATKFATQTSLALQHLFRVGRVMEVNWWTVGVAYISHCSPQEALNRAGIAQAAWKNIHQVLKGDDQGDDEEDADVDVWDIKHGMSGGTGVNNKTVRHALPDYNAVQGEASIPPCLVIEVSELPRNVDIEWWSIGLSHARVSIIPYGGSERPTYWSRVTGTSTDFVVVELPHDVMPAFGYLHIFQDGFGEETQWDHVTVFAAPSLPKSVLDFGLPEAVMLVPCRSVWGEGGRSLAGAVVGRRTDRG